MPGSLSSWSRLDQVLSVLSISAVRKDPTKYIASRYVCAIKIATKSYRYFCFNKNVDDVLTRDKLYYNLTVTYLRIVLHLGNQRISVTNLDEKERVEAFKELNILRCLQHSNILRYSVHCIPVAANKIFTGHLQ